MGSSEDENNLSNQSAEMRQREQIAAQKEMLGSQQKYGTEERLAQQAYQQMMDQAARAKGQELMSGAESQLMQETSSAPPELQKLMQDIANNATRAQADAAKQGNLALAQQGVRGGSAAILSQRAAGDLSQKMGQDANKLAYDDVVRRSSERTKYLGQKGATGAASYAR